MILTQIPKFNINQPTYHKPPQVNFCGRLTVQNDIFEKNNSQITDLKLYNWYTDSYCSTQVNSDLSKPQKFILGNHKDNEGDLIVDYDPSRTGYIIDKKNNKPLIVNILKATQDAYEGFTSYLFVSKDLKHEYGYVTFYQPDRNEARLYGISKDYPEYGIMGARLEVLYLKNNDNRRIGGIGKLADRVAVQHCLENDIPTNIISYADVNSHVAHYKRGKRFIPPEENSAEYEFLNKKYRETDPDIILDKLINKSDETGDDVNLSGWRCLLMYLPQNMVDIYRQEIKK